MQTVGFACHPHASDKLNLGSGLPFSHTRVQKVFDLQAQPFGTFVKLQGRGPMSSLPCVLEVSLTF